MPLRILTRKSEPHVESDLVNPQTRADELEERLVNLAVRIVRLHLACPGLLRENTLLGKFCELAPRRHPITVKPEVQKATPISFISCELYLKN